MSAPPDGQLVHATAVAVGDRAALITGPSGAGKSALALHCISQAFLIDGHAITATLLSDDQVRVWAEAGRLIAAPPPRLAGLMEVRGQGILAFPHVASVEVKLVVELARSDRIERLPDPPLRRTIAGIDLPCVEIAPGEPTSPIRLLLALLRS